MCGIVGYIGDKVAAKLIMDGLKRLEYRGYDSSGIAVIENGRLETIRAVGKIKNLESLISDEQYSGTSGIGHIRWATHGKPSEENAHPHTDCSGKIVVVHNGIIENYKQLKHDLVAEGHKFKSETDTEVIVHLIEKYYRKDLVAAVRQATSLLKGAYALAVLSINNPDTVIGARMDAPLVAGIGENEYFLASDIPALLSYTKKFVYLEDGDIIELKKSGYKIYAADGSNAERKTHIIAWDSLMAEKSGYKHFMLKEIFEQQRTIEDTFRGRIDYDDISEFFNELSIDPETVRDIGRISIIACGTSYYAGLIGKFWFETLAGIHAEAEIGSEFRYRDFIIDDRTLLIAISQSGETADTIAPLREGKKRGARTLAICNVMGSTITRDAAGTLYTRCGPEIGVASTKAFTGQITSLFLLAVYFGIVRGKLTKENAAGLIDSLIQIPKDISMILNRENEIISIAKKFFKKTNFLFLGRGLNYPIAMEGALKLKEISYIHAEGYPAGEMKHGPIALIDENLPVVCIATKDKVYEKVLSNIEEVKAREGIVIAIATDGDERIKEKADYVFYVPNTDALLSPLLNIVPLQLFAYHIGVLRGCDVDQPRNLAKSVTVE
ncbi:MAG: Glutamine--fructose-6-phosphate aminotransferase (isomerizing) [Elusimicrobia bacterium ADurb.Bin231]|nr:MAG: Glutamine--fructose-6-phosphate aminotransferase (isomerizing) [Elusimicrobia bacterium ADurb.Bin231]